MRSGEGLKTLAPDIGQDAFLQEKRSPKLAKSAAPAGQKPAPAASLALGGTQLFPKFLAGRVVVDTGIVGGPHDGNHLGNGLGDVLARAEQGGGRRRRGFWRWRRGDRRRATPRA